ncbi:hypothetical protein ON010_g13191 [Phytophthora cinnamomi]|nr:hypothetical protein ON010_g13191 [Phytophthora cinnamomi]
MRVLNAVHHARHEQDAQHHDVVQEDDRSHAGAVRDPHHRQQRERAEQDDRRAHNRNAHLVVEIADAVGGGHDARGQVGQDAQTRREGSCPLGRRVQQGVVGAAVHGDGGDHLLVDEPEEVEHDGHQQQWDGHEFARLGGHGRRRVQHTRQDVIAADGGGW